MRLRTYDINVYSDATQDMFTINIWLTQHTCHFHVYRHLTIWRPRKLETKVAICKRYQCRCSDNVWLKNLVSLTN